MRTRPRRLLAQSTRYRVSHEYETVFLERPGHAEVVIGDFYGDPRAASIDFNERWCLQVGAGLILYWLRDPFQPYAYHCRSDQWWEAHRSPSDFWSIVTVHQRDADHVRFVVDPHDSNTGSYELSLPDFTIRRLSSERK